jgi:hypothetical protein
VLRHETSRTVAQVEMPGAGLRAELEILSARPNRMRMVSTIPGLGMMHSGFDGEVGWSIDPMLGTRLLEGAELQSTMDEANILASVRDASLFAVRETVERAEYRGQPCYRVRLVWQSGRESFDCYSTETGLLVATVSRQESPMGSVEATSHFSDYREFGGVLMPTRIVVEVMGQQQIMTISEVEFDAVDAAEFELPAEIRALLAN